jgi:hypothetical protein
MVNIDQTRQHINFHKNEMQQGGKVTLLRKGWVVTNFIDPGDTITAGQTAFVGPSGYITNSQAVGAAATGSDASAGAFVGRFDSLADEDGYAKVSVNLPHAEGAYLT